MDYYRYIIAWLNYGSELLKTAASLGDIVRDSFTKLHIPKKSEYER
jgi:hypothetical protein